MTLAHAPYPSVEGAPDILVHVPEGSGGAPLHVVLFLHGYSGCVEVLAASEQASCRPGEPPTSGFGVVEAHDRGGRDAILLIPQLAFMQRDGSPGRLARSGEARAMIEEALALAGLSGAVETVTLVAHSAAFETALAVIRNGGLEGILRHVVLLDALYSGGPVFLRWVQEGSKEDPHTLVSIYTGGTPRTRTEALVPASRRALGPQLLASPEPLESLAELEGPSRALFLHVRSPHGEVPRRYLGAVLAALGLPPR